MPDSPSRQREPVTKKLCPCGGNAWSLAELEALCPTEDEKEMWRSLLGPEDYYCADEDDVLLPGQEEDRR
jgi:hypothetical protein